MGEVTQKIVLRDYQTDSIKKMFSAMREHRRVLLVAPTGAGKRIMLTHVATLGAVKNQRRILAVTDRRTLVTQMADECRSWGLDHGVIMGSEPRNDDALIQIASIQTLSRRQWRDVPDTDLLIVDEAHKASKAYSKLFEKCGQAKVLGVTATPVGAKGKSLVPDLFDVMVEGATNSQLIASGHILTTKCWCPMEPDTEGVKIVAGEFNKKEIAQRVEECLVFADVFKYWEPYREMQTIVFAPRVKFAHGIAEQFSAKGFPAEVIEANTIKQDRSDIFERFASRDTRVLVSVDVLREGFDAPIAQCGIDLQPNRQFRTYAQKVGRIRRSYPGQDHAVWLDFAGNFWRFYHPDEDPDWRDVTSDTSIQDLISEHKGKRCKKCGKGDMYKGQCQHCGDRVDEPKEPWSCPKCSYTKSPWETIINGKCPHCGHKGGKPTKRIRMADGTMKEVSLKDKKKRRRQKSPSSKKWSSYLFRGARNDWTLGQARRQYIIDNKCWPSGEDVPHPNSGDWQMLITVLHPGIANWLHEERERMRKKHG